MAQGSGGSQQNQHGGWAPLNILLLLFQIRIARRLCLSMNVGERGPLTLNPFSCFLGFPPHISACRTAAAVSHRQWTGALQGWTETDDHPNAHSDPQPWRRGRTPCPIGKGHSPASSPHLTSHQPQTDLRLGKYANQNYRKYQLEWSRVQDGRVTPGSDLLLSRTIK